MNDFNGIPLKGTPNRPTSFGSGHGYYGYDANGDLKISNFPLQLGFQNGHYVTIFVDVPAQLQASDYVSSFHAETMTLGPGNVVTSNVAPDAPASWKSVAWPVKPDHSDFVSGYTQDPKAGGLWVDHLDENGDPVFGVAPTPVAPGSTLPSDTMTNLVNAAVAHAKALGY